MAMNKSFRNTGIWVKRGAIAAIFGAMSAVMVSCGGGGAAGGAPTAVGTLAILPDSGTMYANVPQLFNIAGGKAPYLVVSNEQTVLPLNFTTSSNTFTAVPNQPGVVDVTTDPNVVPSRKVSISVRDSTGTQISASYDVLQNFLTGYGLSISSIATCSKAAAAATAATQACAGAESSVTLVPVSNGLRYANKQMRLTTMFGAFGIVVDEVTGAIGPTLTKPADSTGAVNFRIKVTPNVPTQYAQFRLADVATGAYRDFTFIITNTNGAATPLSALPSSVSLTGATTASCGTGTVNVFVFGGTPPYVGSTTFPAQIQLSGTTVARSGEAFTVSMLDRSFCLNPGNLVITDATGAFITVDIKTAVGTVDPVLPLSVAPQALCIPDGGSGVINISGGNANKVLNSSNPSLAAALPTSGSGNFTVTINSLGAGGGVGTPVSITVSDGATQVPISITRKTTCP